MLGHKSSEKKYSFGSYSDIHIDGSKKFYQYAGEHWADALKTAAARDVDFIIGSGDYINNQVDYHNINIHTEEWKTYQKILAESDYCNPIYEAIGNHDIWHSSGTSDFINATGLEGSNNKSKKAYFEKDINGDHFIFMALEGGFYTDRVEEFSSEQLDWLEGLLAKYSGDGHNIYIVEHSLFYKYGAGDRVDGEPYYDLPLSDGQASTVRFKSILEKYKDTIFISGHTHIAFREQLNYSDNNDTSAQMVHNSSVGGVRYIKNGGLDRPQLRDQTEGYIVDVYDNAVIFNGANLYYNKYDPNCCYIVRTSEQAYKQMTSTTATTKATTAKPTQGSNPSSYYVKGSFNSWGSSNPLYYTSDSDVVSTTLQLSAGTYTFKINKDSSWYGNSGTIEDTTTKTSKGGWVMDASIQDNCTLKATGGYYTFNFYLSTKKLILLHSTTAPYSIEKSEQAAVKIADKTSKTAIPLGASLGDDFESILKEVEKNLALYYRYSSYDCYQALKKEYRIDKELYASQGTETTSPTTTTTSETTEEPTQITSTDTQTTEELTQATSTEASETTEETTQATATGTSETTEEPTQLTTAEETQTTESQTQATSIEDSETTEETTFTESAETSSGETPSSSSIPVEGKDYTLGDVNEDGNINILDATWIQKYIVKMYYLNGNRFYAADVNKDGKVDIKDATEIQKYAAKLIMSFSGTNEKSSKLSVGSARAFDVNAAAARLIELQNALLAVVDPTNVDDGNDSSGEINIYFENTNDWSSVYAYCWSGGSNNGAWPGKTMTYIGKNEYGKSIYKYTFSKNAYSSVVFNNNSGSQTEDIVITANNMAYYLSSSSSPYSVTPYAFEESYIVSY
ncbi:MAG: starch-binding protein [Ruminococcus sp.]|nr:starch-binding protein [Ruminococcus sp.]